MKGTYIKGTIEKVEGQGNTREREGTYTEDTYKKVQNKMNQKESIYSDTLRYSINKAQTNVDKRQEIKLPNALKLKAWKRKIDLKDKIQFPCDKKSKSDTAFFTSASNKYDFH